MKALKEQAIGKFLPCKGLARLRLFCRRWHRLPQIIQNTSAIKNTSVPIPSNSFLPFDFETEINPIEREKFRVIAEAASPDSYRDAGPGRGIWVAKDAAAAAMTGPPRPWSGMRLWSENKISLLTRKFFRRIKQRTVSHSLLPFHGRICEICGKKFSHDEVINPCLCTREKEFVDTSAAWMLPVDFFMH